MLIYTSDEDLWDAADYEEYFSVDIPLLVVTL